MSDQCHIDPKGDKILKPCPFCGRETTYIKERDFMAFVFCDCGGRGPQGFTQDRVQMAVDLWNRRKQP